MKTQLSIQELTMSYQEIVEIRTKLNKLIVHIPFDCERLYPLPMVTGNYKNEKKEVMKKRKEYIDSKYQELGFTISYLDDLKNRQYHLYEQMPNEEKYRKEINLLEEIIKYGTKKQVEQINYLLAVLKANNSNSFSIGLTLAKLDATWYLTAKRFVTKFLEEKGYKIYHKSDSSLYFEKNTHKIRISNHDLPSTPEREHNLAHGIVRYHWNEYILKTQSIKNVEEEIYNLINLQNG